MKFVLDSIFIFLMLVMGILMFPFACAIGIIFLVFLGLFYPILVLSEKYERE